MLKHGTLSPTSVQPGLVKNTAAPQRQCSTVISEKETGRNKELLKSSQMGLSPHLYRRVNRGAEAKENQGFPIPRMLELLQNKGLWLQMHDSVSPLCSRYSSAYQFLCAYLIETSLFGEPSLPPAKGRRFLQGGGQGDGLESSWPLLPSFPHCYSLPFQGSHQNNSFSQGLQKDVGWKLTEGKTKIAGVSKIEKYYYL